jgi:hypothetical protein
MLSKMKDVESDVSSFAMRMPPEEVKRWLPERVVAEIYGRRIREGSLMSREWP